MFHLRRVAHWRGLTWEYFRALPTDDQAGYIAEYETTMRLDALEAIESQRDRERRRKRR